MSRRKNKQFGANRLGLTTHDSWVANDPSENAFNYLEERRKMEEEMASNGLLGEMVKWASAPIIVTPKQCMAFYDDDKIVEAAFRLRKTIENAVKNAAPLFGSSDGLGQAVVKITVSPSGSTAEAKCDADYDADYLESFESGSDRDLGIR